VEPQACGPGYIWSLLVLSVRSRSAVWCREGSGVQAHYIRLLETCSWLLCRLCFCSLNRFGDVVSCCHTNPAFQKSLLRFTRPWPFHWPHTAAGNTGDGAQGMRVPACAFRRPLYSAPGHPPKTCVYPTRQQTLRRKPAPIPALRMFQTRSNRTRPRSEYRRSSTKYCWTIGAWQT
jgi:hypothetical protein